MQKVDNLQIMDELYADHSMRGHRETEDKEDDNR
jgi:hypothetical protein